MYAIFRAKGKQFRAEPEATLRIPSLEAEPGERVTFEEVLLAERDGDVLVGTPALSGASVAAEVVRHGKGEKIVVFKFKRRKNYRRKQGHRQKFTEIRILDIDLAGAPKKAKGRKKVAEAEEGAPPPPEAKAAKGLAAAEAKVEEPEAAEVGAPEAAEPEAAAEVEITDAAREVAEEHGIDIAAIEGTGKDGRILKGDVEKAIKAREQDEAEE